jgi:hypothetical protein
MLKKIVPLSEANFEVRVIKSNFYWWLAEPSDKVGLANKFAGNNYQSKENAINEWEEFAKLNGITNYKFVE